MSRGGKVLVFGDDTRSFLATVRSLARKGVEVHVAPFDFSSVALKSRYIHKIHWVPYYAPDSTEWLDAVNAIAAVHNFDLIIPCDERAMLPLRQHRDKLIAARIALPDDHSFNVFYDKLKTREVAQALDVPVAAGRLITKADTVDGILAEASLPLVIKPSQSYVLSNLYQRGRVTVVEDEDALRNILPSAQDGMHLFETYFPGHGVGVSVLSRQGRVLEAFEHHRVHERGGSGYYRVSAPVSASLAEAIKRIVAAVAYTGLAMFEFKVNRDSSAWILLEVNARPWGSLPLPVGLGVDFPYDWYRLLVNGEEPPFRSYKNGIYARNVVPDTLAIFAEIKECRQPRQIVRLLLRTAWEYRRMLIGREFHDVMVWDDPAPGFTEFAELLRSIGPRLTACLPGAEQRHRRRDRKAVRSAVEKAEHEKFNVVFVCQGNICRSPFAARIFQRQAASLAPTDDVDSARVLARSIALSAGMLPRWGKVPPAAAVEAARHAGIDVTDHRSCHLSREMAERADLVVIFDGKNLRYLHQRYPHLSVPVVWLGCFDDDASEGLEIADPDGGDLPTFQRAYARIESAIDGLTAAIRQADGK